jgi:RNA-binding protein YlmH
LLLFPDYIADMCNAADWESQSVSIPLSLAGEDDPICALSVCGSGYRTLTHRDYLGSLLALGLEREVLGDIDVPDEHHATLFCRASIADYLLTAVERIGNDKVKIERIALPPDFRGSRRRQPISDTVASARLDCVVAALANLSRDTAQSAIRDGRVELDYLEELRVDRTVEPPCTISLRGVGKFNVLSIATQTKKGRWRLLAEKYT